MTPPATDAPDIQARPRRTALAVWLVLVPVIFITLACCGQLALLLNQSNYPSVDTRSRLKAGYLAWPYSEIPPINIAAFLEDLQADLQGEQGQPGTPTGPAIIVVEEGEIVVLPTNTPGPIAQVSPTPTAQRQTPTVFVQTVTPTFTPSPTETRRPTDTHTPPPSVTPTPTSTNTLPPLPPTSTYTRQPPRPPRRTPTYTPSPTPVTPSPTYSDTPDTPTPTYAPVRPIAENNGESEIDPLGRGCLAYFGYRNDNPTQVIIPLGERNYFSQPYVFIDPDPPPSVFEIERVSPAFMVIWDTGEEFIWYLDGRQAVARWCSLPLPEP